MDYVNRPVSGPPVARQLRIRPSGQKVLSPLGRLGPRPFTQLCMPGEERWQHKPPPEPIIRGVRLWRWMVGMVTRTFQQESNDLMASSKSAPCFCKTPQSFYQDTRFGVFNVDIFRRYSRFAWRANDYFTYGTRTITKLVYLCARW